MSAEDDRPAAPAAVDATGAGTGQVLAVQDGRRSSEQRSAAPRAVRVALLGDDEALLASVGAWFRAHAPGFEVVLAATSWPQLVHSTAFPADLVLMDVQPHEPVSFEARIRTCRAAGASVVVLTALDTPDLRERARRAGAAAFLRASLPMEEVLAAAHEVVGCTATHRDWRPLPRAAERLERPRLSLGEEAALRLYASGRSTNEVAAELHVRFETAKTYLRRVREKYAGVRRPASRKADLVRRATEDGYI